MRTRATLAVWLVTRVTRVTRVDIPKTLMASDFHFIVPKSFHKKFG